MAINNHLCNTHLIRKIHCQPHTVFYFLIFLAVLYFYYLLFISISYFTIYTNITIQKDGYTWVQTQVLQCSLAALALSTQPLSHQVALPCREWERLDHNHCQWLLNSRHPWHSLALPHCTLTFCLHTAPTH